MLLPDRVLGVGRGQEEGLGTAVCGLDPYPELLGCRAPDGQRQASASSAEVACRGGTSTVWWSGDDPQDLAGTLNTAEEADGFAEVAPAGSFEGAVEALVNSGLAVIGDPEDAIAQLERLESQSGGFGAFLFMAHNWADWSATRRSYELFARYVMPRFQDLNEGREASMKWASSNCATFMGAYGNAVNQEIH